MLKQMFKTVNFSFLFKVPDNLNCNFLKNILLYFLFLLCVCSCVCMCVHTLHTYVRRLGAQETTVESWFSSSTMWAPGI